MPPEDQADAASDTAAEEAGTESVTDDAAALKAENARLKALARKHEDRAKENFAWRKANEDKVQQYDALSEASKTEQERAVEQARKDAAAAARAEADADALSKFGPRLVGAEFRAQLAGRMSAEQIDTLVGGLDVRRFLTDAGEPDAEAVAGYVSAIPSAAPAEPAKPTRVDLGGGRREVAKMSAFEAGQAESQARRERRARPA